MTTRVEPAPRRGGLDAVRAGALLLGVAYHATWAYMPGIGPWYVVQDPHTAEWMAPLAATLQTLRMPVFFALAGYFARGSVLRRGAARTLLDRLRRLGWPLLFGAPLIAAADLWSRRWAHAWALLHPAYPGGTTLLARPLHLWFLEYLLLFIGAACVIEAVAGRSRSSRAGAASAHGSRLGSLPWVAAAVPAGLLQPWIGDPTPAFSFLPQVAAVTHFGPFFAYGWWLGARRPLDSVPGNDAATAGWRPWVAGAAAAAGASVAAVAASSALDGRFAGPMLAALAAWLAVPGFLELGLALPRIGGSWLRATADASYWVYLVHYPLVLGGQLAFTRLDWPAELKWLALTTLVTAAAGVSFAVLVRGTRIGEVLGARSGAPPRAIDARPPVDDHRDDSPGSYDLEPGSARLHHR